MRNYFYLKDPWERNLACQRGTQHWALFSKSHLTIVKDLLQFSEKTDGFGYMDT